eukprot:TRINITY_DN12940_c0_g1_i2.p1 TRINITY_DN12940_c0_g1~~TRINITY_DN12940_c0_g1_i2.p1  ORF type:complete len:579 (-),score=166.10 TRINITY_DN12940_c0_g1_i2:42-1778(-)
MASTADYNCNLWVKTIETGIVTHDRLLVVLTFGKLWVDLDGMKLETKARAHIEKRIATFNESLNFGFDPSTDKKVVLTIYGVSESNALKSLGNCAVSLKGYCKDVTARKNALQKLTLKVLNCADRNTYIEVWLSLSAKEPRKESVTHSARMLPNKKLLGTEKEALVTSRKTLCANGMQNRMQTRKNSTHDFHKAIFKNTDCSETKESGLMDNVSDYIKENYCSAAHRRANTSFVVPCKSRTEFQKVCAPSLKSPGNKVAPADKEPKDIQELRRTIDEQASIIRKQERKIKEQESEVKSLESVLTTRKAEIAVLRMKVGDKKEASSVESPRVKELEQLVDKLREDNQSLHTAVTRLSTELEELAGDGRQCQEKGISSSKSLKELPWKSQFLEPTMNEVVSPECMGKDDMCSFSCDQLSSSESMISAFTRTEHDKSLALSTDKVLKNYIKLFISAFNEQLAALAKRIHTRIQTVDCTITSTLKSIVMKEQIPINSARTVNNILENETVKLREENQSLVQSQFSLIKTIEVLKLRIAELEQCPVAAIIAGLRDQNKKRTKNLKRCIPVSYTHLTLPTICSV